MVVPAFSAAPLVTLSLVSSWAFPSHDFARPPFVRRWTIIHRHNEVPFWTQVGVVIGRSSPQITDGIITALHMAALAELTRFGTRIVPDIWAYPRTVFSPKDREQSPGRVNGMRYHWIMVHRPTREWCNVKTLLEGGPYTRERKRALEVAAVCAKRYHHEGFDVSDYLSNLRCLFDAVDRNNMRLKRRQQLEA